MSDGTKRKIFYQELILVLAVDVGTAKTSQAQVSKRNMEVKCDLHHQI